MKLTPEQVDRLTAERAEQGLPPQIEDVAVLTRIAAILRPVVTPPPATKRKRRP